LRPITSSAPPNCACQKADAEDREIAAGDDFCSNRFRIAACREIHVDFRAAENAVEKLTLLLEVAADWIGHEVPGAEAAGDVIAVPIDKDDAGGILDRQSVQDHLIDQRVDGGGSPDAEGQREQRHRGEAGAAEERSRGEAKIVEEIAEPAGEPDIPDFLAHLSEAELDGDAAAGLGFGNTGRGEVTDAAIEVILQLAVEAALQGPAAEPVPELDHRLPSSKISLTAPERRAQLFFSKASWRRPACVRE